MALDPSTHDGLAKLTASLKERASPGENLSSTYVMWGFFTAAAMVSAIAVLFTPQADRRISQAMNTPPSAMQQAFPQPGQQQALPQAGQPSPDGAPMVARIGPPPPPAAAKPSPEEEILLTRLKLLEEQLDNVTGSIAKQAAAPPPPPPPPPSGVTPSNEPKQAKAPPPAPAEPEAAEVVVQIPAQAPAQAAEPVTTAAVSTSFGLDLGSESSFGALRARWETLRRDNPELARLQPRISVRDNKGRVELRLIAGPFSTASEAARACAQLFVKGVSCDGGLFDGQRLPQS